ncbi:MAG: CarD family transcriptional regulator [Clostridiaceae bacterium]|nr:CarD family transcriptional regulator [Clostridiaceae bacterium]
MYKIGDSIMFGNCGACRILDIHTRPDNNNDSTLYYILQPIFDENSRIYFPVNSDKVFLRSLYSKQEVEQLIASMGTLEPLWIDDKKEREIKYRDIFKSCDSQVCMRMLKGLYLKKKDKIAGGKTLSESDILMYRSAEKLLFEEFALALNIPVGSVSNYINARLQQKPVHA